MEKLATHSGTVIAVENNHVRVEMQVLSACASCEAHAKCTFAEKKEKVVDIDTPDWQRYQVGDAVNVIINTSRGFLAVFIAYILPAVLLVGTLVALCLLRLPELLAAILTLVVIGLYGVVLCLFRGKLQRKFTFGIEKLNKE